MTKDTNGIKKSYRILQLIAITLTILLFIGGMIATTAIKSDQIDCNTKDFKLLKKTVDDNIKTDIKFKAVITTKLDNIENEIKEFKTLLKEMR